MATRRAVIASAALAPLATAEAATPVPSRAIRRITLSRIEAAGRVTLVQRLELPAGVTLARHSHPGAETTRVLAGAIALDLTGTRRTLRAGDEVTIPAGVPHSARSLGPATLVVTWRGRSDEPLATPA
jgi:quercetin dioxygenase-like cupin family protein